MYSVPVAGYAPSQASISIDTNISSSNLSSINASITNATINNLTTTIFNPVSITCDSLDVQNLTVDNSIALLNVETLNVSTKNVCQLNVINATMTNISVQNISCTSFTSPDVQPLLIAGDNVSILNNIINVTNDALLPSNANFSSINTSSLTVNNNVVIGGTTYITDLIVSDVINCSTIQANNLSTAEMQFGNSLAYDAVAKILEVNTTDTISSGNTLPVTSGAVFNSLNTQTTTISTMWSYMLSEPEFVLVNSTINSGAEDTICYLDITPQYEGSKIHVEFCFSYSVTGFGTDSIVTEIRVGKNNNLTQTIIQELFQEWNGNAGGGTRSGASGTISASYQNTDTLGKYHRIQLRVDNNSDDTWGLDSTAFVSIKVIEFIETAGTSNPNILIGSGNISCGNISCNTITALNHTIDNLITTENVNVGGSMVTVGFPESGVIVASSMVRLAGGAVVQNWADMAWDGTTFNISTRQSTKNFKVSFGQVAYLEVDSTNVSVQSLIVNQGLEVLGSLTYNDLILNDSLLVNGNLIASTATFDNDVVFERDVDIEQTLNVSNINVSGNIVVAGTITGSNISTAALIPGTNITITNNIISAFVQSDAAIVISSLHVDNNANIYGVLNVSQTSNFEQSLNVNNQLFVGKAGEINGNLVIYSTNIGDNFQIQNGVTETSLLGTGNISRFNFSLLGNQTLTITPTQVNISGDLIVSGNITGTLSFENLSVSNLSVGTMSVDLIDGDLNAADIFGTTLTTTGRVETGKWLIGASDSTTASLYNNDITSVTTHYALRQTDGAATSINGTAVYFKNLGTDVGEWNATGLGVGKTTPTTTLDVLGTSLFTGTLNVEGTLNVSGELKPNYIETSDFNLSEGTGQYTKIYRTANQTLFIGNNNTAGSDYVFYPLTSSDQPALQIKRDLTTVIQDLQVVALIEAANICTDQNISCTGSISIGDDLRVVGDVNISGLLETDNIMTSEFNLSESSGQYTKIYRTANQTLFIGNNNTAGSDYVFYPLTSSDQPALQIKRDLTTVIQDLQVVALIEAANICTDQNISCTGSISIGDDLHVTGNVNISGDVTVTGETFFLGGVDLDNVSAENISATTLSTTGHIETGKWFIGASDSTTASLYNKDVSPITTHYALRQTNGAATSINGTAVYFKNLGVDVGEWNATGLGVGKTTPSKKLDVLGDSLFTGNVNISGILAADQIVGIDLLNICSTNISTTNLSASQTTSQNINCSTFTLVDTAGAGGLDVTGVGYFRTGLFAYNPVYLEGDDNYFGEPAGTSTRSRINFWSQKVSTEVGIRFGCDTDDIVRLNLPRFGLYTHYNINISNTSTMDMDNTSTKFHQNVNISGTLTADTIALTNICFTNISTSNLSVSNDLQVDGILDTFDLVSDTGSIGVLDSTTANVSTINASTINGANLSTASMLFNSDFQFSLNTLSLASGQTATAIQSATLATLATQVDSLFGNFSTFNAAFGTIAAVLNMQFANTSQINASNVIGINISATNFSGVNMSATTQTLSNKLVVSNTTTSTTQATIGFLDIDTRFANSVQLGHKNFTGLNDYCLSISAAGSTYFNCPSTANVHFANGGTECFRIASGSNLSMASGKSILAGNTSSTNISNTNLSSVNITATSITAPNVQPIITDGSLTIARTSGLQTALDGKQATITDGSLTIARTSGLQTALDGKQATIADGDLTIAKTNGLQTALDSKEPTITSATDLTINSLTTTNISTTNLSATEISTASATMGSNTLTMASDKYLESISNYAYYYKNGNSAMTGTTHLVEFNSNTLQSALITKTSNSRYTINRAGYYLVTCNFHPENSSINDRVCYRAVFLKNGLANDAWSGDGFCYTREDDFGEFGTCANNRIISLAVDDYIEVQITCKIASEGLFVSDLTGSLARRRSGLSFQYLG
jgi:hypothetical protein